MSSVIVYSFAHRKRLPQYRVRTDRSAHGSVRGQEEVLIHIAERWKRRILRFCCLWDDVDQNSSGDWNQY